MNEEQLDTLIATARRTYNDPPPSDLDRLWRGVSRRRRLRGFRISGRVVGAAAVLGLVFTLGRMSVMPSPSDVEITDPVVAVDLPGDAEMVQPRRTEAYDATTSMLLGESAMLLSAIRVSNESAAMDKEFSRQAISLLGTTRLLIDARGQGDPRLRDLLQDLELVLAQIARLQPSGAREELELITDALRQQNIVPRIHRVAAGLSAGN
jgi:hypothetical protein